MVPGISLSDFLEATAPLRSARHRLRQKLLEADSTACCFDHASDSPKTSEGIREFAVRGLHDRGLYRATVVDGLVGSVTYSSWVNVSYKETVAQVDEDLIPAIDAETTLPKKVSKILVEYARDMLTAQGFDVPESLKAKNLRQGFAHIIAMNEGHTFDTGYLALLSKLVQIDSALLKFQVDAEVTPFVVEFICGVGVMFREVTEYLESLDADAPADDADAPTDDADAPVDSDTKDDEEPHLLTLLRELRDKEPTEAIKGIKTLLSSLPPLPTVKVSVSKVSVDSSEVNFDATARVVSGLNELVELSKDVDSLLLAEDMILILRAMERLNKSRMEQ